MAALRPLQFRLTSLMVAMFWACVAAWSLASPTELTYAVMLLLTLAMCLTSVLGTIFLIGRSRAFSAGFMLFGFGHVLCIYLIAGTFYRAIRDPWSPVVAIVMHFNSLKSSSPLGDNFLANCHFVATVLLGCLGGFIGDVLHSQRSD